MIIMGGDIEDWGIIPTFLDADDPRGVKEQFNDRYIGGWHPFPGFTLDKKSMQLKYPGDPPTEMRSIMFFKGEVIILYEFDWVLVLAKDGSWEVCRMD